MPSRRPLIVVALLLIIVVLISWLMSPSRKDPDTQGDRLGQAQEEPETKDATKTEKTPDAAQAEELERPLFLDDDASAILLRFRIIGADLPETEMATVIQALGLERNFNTADPDWWAGSGWRREGSNSFWIPVESQNPAVLLDSTWTLSCGPGNDVHLASFKTKQINDWLFDGGVVDIDAKVLTPLVTLFRGRITTTKGDPIPYLANVEPKNHVYLSGRDDYSELNQNFTDANGHFISAFSASDIEDWNDDDGPLWLPTRDAGHFVPLDQLDTLKEKSETQLVIDVGDVVMSGGVVKPTLNLETIAPLRLVEKSREKCGALELPADDYLMVRLARSEITLKDNAFIRVNQSTLLLPVGTWNAEFGLFGSVEHGTYQSMPYGIESATFYIPDLLIRIEEATFGEISLGPSLGEKTIEVRDRAGRSLGLVSHAIVKASNIPAIGKRDNYELSAKWLNDEDHFEELAIVFTYFHDRWRISGDFSNLGVVLWTSQLRAKAFTFVELEDHNVITLADKWPGDVLKNVKHDLQVCVERNTESFPDNFTLALRDKHGSPPQLLDFSARKYFRTSVQTNRGDNEFYLTAPHDPKLVLSDHVSFSGTNSASTISFTITDSSLLAKVATTRKVIVGMEVDGNPQGFERGLENCICENAYATLKNAAYPDSRWLYTDTAKQQRELYHLLGPTALLYGEAGDLALSSRGVSYVARVQEYRKAGVKNLLLFDVPSNLQLSFIGNLDRRDFHVISVIIDNNAFRSVATLRKDDTTMALWSPTGKVSLHLSFDGLMSEAISLDIGDTLIAREIDLDDPMFTGLYRTDLVWEAPAQREAYFYWQQRTGSESSRIPRDRSHTYLKPGPSVLEAFVEEWHDNDCFARIVIHREILQAEKLQNNQLLLPRVTMPTYRTVRLPVPRDVVPKSVSITCNVISGGPAQTFEMEPGIADDGSLIAVVPTGWKVSGAAALGTIGDRRFTSSLIVFSETANGKPETISDITWTEVPKNEGDSD